MTRVSAEPLPVVSIAAVPPLAGERWLVEGLWASEGVGIIGGAPKSYKTWLALDLAVSVASGTPALGCHPVTAPGRVLVFCAEDHPAHVRERVEGIALARGLTLTDLNLALIATSVLMLDSPAEAARLRATVARERPRLLILDPLVRLHRGDENSSNDVALLLGELRALQRDFGTSVALVHHFKKRVGNGQEGLALRGSGDLYAWGDSNLYLRRRKDEMVLTVEHRAAPSFEPCSVELVLDPAPHLRRAGAAVPAEGDDLPGRVVELLSAATAPVTRATLRETLKVRNATLGEVLSGLEAEGRIRRENDGYRTSSQATTTAVPVPAPGENAERNASGVTPGPTGDPTPIGSEHIARRADRQDAIECREGYHMPSAMILGGYEAARYSLRDGAELVVVADFLPPAESRAARDACVPLEWEHQRIMGTPTLRANAWLAPDAAWTYRYSKKVWLPQTLPDALVALVEKLRAATGVDFNTALATDYPDGRAAVGWHADDEPEFGMNPPLASVSIGAPRVFQLLHRSTKPSTGAKPDLEIEVIDGSLVLMLGTFQHEYRHALKKGAASVGRRLNLSFRRYVAPSGADARAGTDPT